MPHVRASNPLFYFQSIKIILGPSNAWSMRRSTQQPSVLYWKLSDFLIKVGGSGWADWPFVNPDLVNANSIHTYICLASKILSFLKPLQNKKDQKKLGYPTKKQSFYKEKRLLFCQVPQFFGPSCFEAAVWQNYLLCNS